MAFLSARQLNVGLAQDALLKRPLCTPQSKALTLARPSIDILRQLQRGLLRTHNTSAVIQEKSQNASPEPSSEPSEHGVQAVLFDLDGVLCDSEDLSRRVGVQVLKELYDLEVSAEEFIPFVGTGEVNFLGGVARKYAAPFDAVAAKQRFFELYLEEASKPGSEIGYPGARELVMECRKAGLKTAVASSADRVKVDANLRAAGFAATEDFDVIISADKFELLKPAPDVFLAAAQALGVHPETCIVIEDAPAGIQAARAAGMRCIGVATSLSLEQMAKEGPDATCSRVSVLGLSDIMELQADKDRALSGLGASTSAPKSMAHHGGLNATVQLPGGYRTGRRELLKLLPLVGVVGAGYALSQNAKTLSYVSPNALLKALFPERGPQAEAQSDAQQRVAAFERYIASKEGRQAMEEVPEFPEGLRWFNSAPLKLGRELRGKVLIYDFWTYCCINCLHVLPSLAALEKRYQGQPVAVVGVHSAKFDNEKDDESIRNAIIRYEVRHPCVNDRNMVLWRDLGISSWPTLAVVSPKGKLIATLPGEGQEESVDAFIQAALSYYGSRGELDNSPLPIALEREKDARLASSPLRYPGKLAADLAGKRLFISDSNNNRIVVTDLNGTFLDHIGGNGPRLVDGSYEEAAFQRPQGLAFSSRTNTLYVADTENHALRKVDLGGKRVTTLAGNGRKGSDYQGGRRGRNQQLNSPWDLALNPEGSSLYIAMAGQHQIWRHDVASGATGKFSGDGSERNANGAADGTAWAQPSGLSLSPDGQQLWVADSESSSIRSLSLRDASSQGHVGGDPLFSENLFRFGDRDGQGSSARLQHPLAVCCLENGMVLVADSYNHRLKVLEPNTDQIRSVAGSGVAGFADGTGNNSRLSEPGGLALGPQGSVFVADTNNSLVRRWVPGTGQLETLALTGVPAPRISPDEDVATATGVPPGAALVTTDPVKASSGELRLAISLPTGYHLTEGANSRFEASTSTPGAIAIEPKFGNLDATGTPVASLRFRRSAAAELRVGVKVYYCQEEDVCLFEEVVFEIPFARKLLGEEVVVLDHEVPAPKPNSFSAS